jgi:hypothetical protein
MNPTTIMAAASGNAVYIDGVDVTSPQHDGDPVGNLFGLANRDDAATHQTQMDEGRVA